MTRNGGSILQEGSLAGTTRARRCYNRRQSDEMKRVFNRQSGDWAASTALAEKLFREYKE